LEIRSCASHMMQGWIIRIFGVAWLITCTGVTESGACGLRRMSCIVVVF